MDSRDFDSYSEYSVSESDDSVAVGSGTDLVPDLPSKRITRRRRRRRRRQSSTLGLGELETDHVAASPRSQKWIAAAEAAAAALSAGELDRAEKSWLELAQQFAMSRGI